MARLSRIIAAGYPHHVTQRGVRSLDIFQSDEDRRSYLQYVKEETERVAWDYPWSGAAYHIGKAETDIMSPE